MDLDFAGTANGLTNQIPATTAIKFTYEGDQSGRPKRATEASPPSACAVAVVSPLPVPSHYLHLPIVVTTNTPLLSFPTRYPPAAVGATSLTLVKAMRTEPVEGMLVSGPKGIPPGTTVKTYSPPLTGTVIGAMAGAASLTMSTALSTVPSEGMRVTGHTSIPAGTTVKAGSTDTQIELAFVAPATELTAPVPENTVLSFGTHASVIDLDFTAPATGITANIPATDVIKFEYVEGF